MTTHADSEYEGYKILWYAHCVYHCITITSRCIVDLRVVVIEFWHGFTDYKEYGCYEAKIEESEKGGSRRESNPGHLWLEPPVLCYWATTAGRPPTLTTLYMCTAQVVLKQNASVTHLAATQYVSLSLFSPHNIQIQREARCSQHWLQLLLKPELSMNTITINKITYNPRLVSIIARLSSTTV